LLGARRLEGGVEPVHVLAIDFLDVPALGLEAHSDVL
jgi:hypothetical protein